jgi:Domain of unknown function (DUF5668)/B-box zinc finger
MNCAVHTDQPAIGYCRNCGKAMCQACTREVGGALYCEPCLSNVVATGQPLAPVASKPGANPGVAALLGMIPGLGAVYNAQYMKALLHVLILGGIIGVLSSDVPEPIEALCIVSLVCFYFYMPIEAYRTAKARAMGEPDPVSFTTVDATHAKPIGAFVLIGIGALWLMRNFGFFEHDWFRNGWPLALIAIGVWLVWDRIKKTS